MRHLDFSKGNWRDQKSSKEQHQYMESQMRDRRWSYDQLINYCNQVTGRNASDIGSYTKGEASDIIDALKAGE